MGLQAQFTVLHAARATKRELVEQCKFLNTKPGNRRQDSRVFMPDGQRDETAKGAVPPLA